MNGIVIAVIVIAVVILAAVLIWYLRMRHFRPTGNKAQQQRMLNDDLEETGFAYELRGDYFYSLTDCWQRDMGYCRLYDDSAHLFNMIMDCEPVTFSYAGKKWLIELWKGQYGITTGAEIGVYNTWDGEVDTEEFHGTYYEAVSDEEMLPMSFVLKKNRKVLLKRKGVHWWMTGFKLGEYSESDELTMDAKLRFPDQRMCRAFVRALREAGYQSYEYTVRGNAVKLHYDKPHTLQPLAGRPGQKALVQQVNENNCRLYDAVTIRYKDTMDKLEYLKAGAPELYRIFVDSLYAKGLYDMFGWLLDLIHGGGHKPKPPKPPCKPCPPEPPCPPKPPCKPEPPCPPKPPCKPEPPCPPEPPCKPL